MDGCFGETVHGMCLAHQSVLPSTPVSDNAKENAELGTDSTAVSRQAQLSQPRSQLRRDYTSPRQRSRAVPSWELSRSPKYPMLSYNTHDQASPPGIKKMPVEPDLISTFMRRRGKTGHDRITTDNLT
jgi:hypothetical protein